MAATTSSVEYELSRQTKGTQDPGELLGREPGALRELVGRQVVAGGEQRLGRDLPEALLADGLGDRVGIDALRLEELDELALGVRVDRRPCGAVLVHCPRLSRLTLPGATPAVGHSLGSLHMLTDDEVQRALVIVAHPDDVDFGAAGTVATWTGAGIEVAYCVVTDGDAGGFDPNVPRAEIPGIRRAEQTAAAKVVGVSDLAFLGYPDGRLTATLDLRRDLAREIRASVRNVCCARRRSATGSASSPVTPTTSRPARRRWRRCTPTPATPSRTPSSSTRATSAWSVLEVWMMASPVRNRWVDVTDAFPRKLDALRSHVSQDTDVDGKLEERMRGWVTMVAQEAGLPDGHLAEGFFAIHSAG